MTKFRYLKMTVINQNFHSRIYPVSMEAALWSFETLLTTYKTTRHNSQDHNLN
jgi:hypothetical protein